MKPLPRGMDKKQPPDQVLSHRERQPGCWEMCLEDEQLLLSTAWDLIYELKISAMSNHILHFPRPSPPALVNLSCDHWLPLTSEVP